MQSKNNKEDKPISEKQRHKESLLGYYQQVFSTDKGKSVLKHIKDEICRFDKSTFTDDTNTMLIAEGKRLAWIELKKWLDEKTLKDIEQL